MFHSNIFILKKARDYLICDITTNIFTLFFSQYKLQKEVFFQIYMYQLIPSLSTSLVQEFSNHHGK